jgi:glycosyltransferase involved in cell wall biosynthesis
VEFNPKVSIVIPVYNGANYLREAIDSALAQTYKNIEVIVVNDGSNDGGKTEEIARSYGYKIRYFYKENGGVASSLNLGIREMTGEWFAWLSHDDLFSPNRIEEDMNIVRINPDVKVTFCKPAFIDARGKLIKECGYQIQKVTNPREALLLDGVNMCTMTIHRSCFEKAGLFNESNRTTQDVEMSLFLSKYYPYYLNSKSTSYSREHPERGQNKLKEQHKKDLLLLSQFIRNNFTLSDFFPNINNKDKGQLANAWAWLGDLYCGFGAYEYADRCYKEGFSVQRRLLSTVGMKYLIGARIIDSNLFRLIVKFKAVVENLFKG